MKVQIKLDTYINGEDSGEVLMELEERDIIGINYNEEYFTIDLQELQTAIEVLKENNDKLPK